MKLPEHSTSGEYVDIHVGQKSATLLHNEQIAAQLTMCVFRPHNCEDTIANISRTYKIFLDKLNRGDL